MRKSRLVAALICGFGALAGGTGAVAQRHAPEQPIDSIEVVPDWEASDAFIEQMISRNAPKSVEVIAQEIATHEIGRHLAEGRVSVLVHMDQGLARGVNVRQSVQTFAAQNRGAVRYEYGAAYPNVVNLRGIPEGMIKELKKLPGVAKVEIDQYHPNVVKLHDSIPLIRGLQSQITGAGYSADGSGVRICIVDTGIDSDHIMYSSRIDTAKGYDFYNDDNNPEDDNGHGSHCSGIAAGGLGISWDPCGTGSVPLQGVAPAATLIGCKVLNSGGGGFDSDIIAGIDYCADQTASGAQADVISMSIGTGNFAGICTHSWAVAANNAAANGVVAIAASGNENNANSMGSPACGVNVIAVGMTWKADYPTCEDATTNWSWGVCTDFAPQTDDVGCFSNESDFLDVTAPGANIWSASIAAGGSQITGSSGTSMSCPTVAGLAALVLDVDPTLTPGEVRQIIRDGAIDMGPAGFDRGYGWGRIDVLNTLALLTPCTGDPDCDDGQWCNGAETCVASSCVSGTDPCPGQSCDEVNDQCLAAPTMQYEWDMNTNPGWTMAGLWAYGTPTGGGGQHGGPDPTSGATGANVLGYNLAGDYPNNLVETNLTTAAIDCSNLDEVSVRFQRWLGVEVSTYDHAYVRVSNNGTSWTTVWQNSAEVADTSWSQQTFDISAIADGQSTVYVRWTMGTTDGSWQYCGWNVDDVQIWGRDIGGGCSVPADCDDGLWCNGAEDCVAGSCVAGSAPNCDDTVACTTDSCNEGTDSCDNVPSDGLCDDGQYCNGVETCHATLGCQAGSTVNCSDGVPCTDDSCNEGSDSCDNVVNDGNCDDGAFCNGAETCNGVLDCQAGSDPCPGQICDEGTDTCNDCTVDGDCTDGIYCNGAETCNAGACQAGTPPNCNDGVACTDDSCNEGTDSCDNVANDGNCDNGQWCDGSEFCHATSDCQFGTAPNCDDLVGCTDDSCNEGTDSCDNVANDANCDNAIFCDGVETCHATLDCQAGSDPCQGQLCDEGGAACVDCFTNGDCDDGLFCNGVETCGAGTCQAGSDPCPGQSCNEITDTCEAVECIDNGDCDDGSACTVDTCVGSVCVNDCAASVSTYPYSEDFEAGLGAWSNVGGDVFDWTRNSGSTPSSNTGPSGDHTTGSGFYLYTEMSSPRSAGDTAIFEGPCMDLTGTSTVELSFWYHMYGATVGTMVVEVSDDCATWTNVLTLSGNQGNTWFEASVNLDAYAGSTIKVRFIATRGSSWDGDIAIDDVSVDAVGVPCSTDPECDDSDACTTDACVGSLCQNTPINCDDANGCTTDSCSGGVCSSTCPGLVASYPDTEDYEAGFGDWANVGGDDFDWLRNSGGTLSTGTGPSGDHTTGSGFYMYVEASSPNYPALTGILEGPCVDLSGSSSASLSFWYHMMGSAVGTLYLEVSDDCSVWTTAWSLSGDQGNAWLQANVDLSAWTGSVVTIRFRGVTGSSWQGDMCIDDLLLDAAGGPECVVPADCDDGLYCNGAEDCVAGNCVAGTAVTCDDSVACTDDSCNEGTDSCDFVENDANCDNGAFCDGSETCDAGSGCLAGSAVDCDDAILCTSDSCNEGADSCDNTPNDAACANGVFCDGAEVCTPGVGCEAGSTVDCDDSVACTIDSCNEGTDSCDNTPDDGFCDDGAWCNGGETCHVTLDCQADADPCPGQGCDEVNDECLSGPVAQLESGSVLTDGVGVTVNLVNNYASPVVVCSMSYDTSTIPTVVRVGNVTSTSFDVWLQNAGSGSVATESVSYLVVEEGTWNIGGVNIEAQLYNSTITDENNSWVGEARAYGQSYTTPVVLGQVMSDNDADWSVFWCQGTSRTNPPISTALRTGKTVCEDTTTARANETVGFVVIETSHGTINGVEFEAAVTTDGVAGVTNSPPYLRPFNTAFGSAPTIALTTMAGVDGGNGGWSQTHGATVASTTNIFLSIDEDTIGDVERNHTGEQVGYLVFDGALVYP